MRQVGLILVRLFVMIVGYGTAALVASFFLHFVAWPAIGMDFEEAPWELMGGLFFSIPLIGLFIATAAFFPALVLLAIAEYFRIRNWLFYALAGGGCALGAHAILWSGMSAFQAIDFGDGSPSDRLLLMEPELLLYGVVAGMVGAIAYWLLAGRGAGSWSDDRLSGTA